MAAQSVSAVPDILAAGLRCVFCGINPGRRSSAAGSHFANPRNDFWRLLADAGLTPRLLDPSEQWDLLGLGLRLDKRRLPDDEGQRATCGAATSPARRSGWSGSPRSCEPGTIAFVGKSSVPGRVRRPAERARPPGARRSAGRRCSCSRRRHPRTRPCRTRSGWPGSRGSPSTSVRDVPGTPRAPSLTFRAPRARFSGLRSKAGGGMGCPG